MTGSLKLMWSHFRMLLAMHACSWLNFQILAPYFGQFCHAHGHGKTSNI